MISEYWRITLKSIKKNTPEQLLAEALTKNYDSLSNLYPEFKRIKELLTKNKKFKYVTLLDILLLI